MKKSTRTSSALIVAAGLSLLAARLHYAYLVHTSATHDYGSLQKANLPVLAACLVIAFGCVLAAIFSCIPEK